MSLISPSILHVKTVGPFGRRARFTASGMEDIAANQREDLEKSPNLRFQLYHRYPP
jgi:hypothetical protein